MENIIKLVRQDMLNLADEHMRIADSEQGYATNTSYPHRAKLHEQSAEEHSALATIYKALADGALTIVKQFGGE